MRIHVGIPSSFPCDKYIMVYWEVQIYGSDFFLFNIHAIFKL